MAKFTVLLRGGLGNQLHNYAFGRALEHRQNKDVRFDCISGFTGDKYGRAYMLDLFPNIRMQVARRGGSGLYQHLSNALTKLSLSFSSRVPLKYKTTVKEPGSFRSWRYCEEILSTRYLFNPLFIGYWLSYRYCESIERLLRFELRPPVPKDAKVLRWLDLINGSLSCFVHYRSYREDSVKMHTPSMKGYYRGAMDRMTRMCPGVRFFIFSDHMDSVREELSDIDADCVFVEIEENAGDTRSMDDFFLMYSCRHAIIGNSTFSWWAAWLSDDPDKVIFAPKGLSPGNADWIPGNWLLQDL